MRSKRLLACLLALCLVLGNLAPMASAVEVPEDSVIAAQHNAEKKADADKAESSPSGNSLIVSPEGTAQRVPTMRDNPVVKSEIETAETTGNGSWQVTPADAPNTSLLSADVPECIGELRAVAELYSANEVVSAFVVMEDQPLAETHSSPRLVSAAAEKALIEKQDAVINAIEKNVMEGEKLEVRYQFTYLTNSFSVKTEFKNLEKIAYIPGVKSVFVMPVYNPCTTSNPNTAASGGMTGVHTVWEELGYTGTGMKIAIIDTGLDLDHPSFEADPALGATSMDVADIEAVLEDLNAYAVRKSITAADLYRSAKVPYAFNYVDASLRADHSMDYQGDHGTHVAGIAAANKTEGTTVVGMAPDAQIIVMKVFGQGGGAYADDIVAALEDAMTLGCDVVNASLGSPNGFASSETELDLIYQRLASQDIIATFSAGNEGTSSYGNMWGTDLNRTQNPDNATVGSPATWANTLAIASAENSEVMTDYFTLADGTKVFFQDSVEAIYANAGYEEYLGAVSLQSLADQTLEYVIIDGLGEAADFYDADGNSLVEGKIAVVKRGELSFANKVANAEAAGAAGVLIWNNNSTDDVFTFGMSTSAEDGSFPGIPSALITIDDGELLAAAETKTMTVSAEQAARVCEGGQMSSFSSWGVSPDLQLVPDITGIGGNVYSCYDGGEYGLMSGTSMSAPQMAGISALVMQHLYTIYPNVPDGTIRDLAEAILMSTAEPIISTDSGVEASPRQQGAGLVNAYAATTATTYLTVGGGRPKAELGDNTNGVYKFTFEIHNIGDEDKTYTLDASLLTEDYAYAGNDLFFMYGMDMALEGSVTFDKDTVTVPAGGRANVAVTIALSDNDKYLFDVVWPNGGYVEGFVYLFNEEGAAELSLPYLGFYGDWTQAPVFDTAYWYDNSFFSMNPANGLPEGDQYYNVLWTDLGGQDWVLGLNPYSGPYSLDGVSIYYDPANNVVSPNGDGVLDGISEMYLSLLRNAKTLTFTYTVEGEVVHEETILNNGKTMYISAYGQVIPWIYSWYGGGMYDFEGLPTGTEVLLTINATVDYGNGGNHTITVPITVDNQKPELLQVIEVPNETEDGTQYLIGAVVSDDISLASVVLMSASGTAIYDQAYDYHLQDLGNGTYLVAFDVTDLGTEFTIAVCDYACNEAYYKVTYESAPDGNLPEMDTTQLYAYRVLDDHIFSDHMYGWVSMNKPESAEDVANISVWTDDYMEYAAINAAEFAGGKIFAVDAVYNLVVMDPGLWSRQTVCNLGVNVIDMTFDDSTDTMYVLSKQGSYTYLYSMDMLTGELTQLKYYGYYSYAPWAIADDDNGTLYAIKYNSANIFTLDVAGGTYAMTAATDADGANVVITDSTGANVTPSAYGQSITWIDGTLYWAYLYSPYYWSYSTELISINTADWSFFSSAYAAQAYDQDGELVDYYPATELVGLLSLAPTDYEIPESTELSGLLMNQTEMILNLGESTQLSVDPLPWNFDLSAEELVWSSSDETVATVDETGFVSTLGTGSVTITAAYGDITAECVISVVKIEGSFNAYNYYSGDGYYGYMINVDLQTMDYYLGNQSPVDFISGDYNGHDGYFYGYTEGGQLYRYDLQNNEVTALGAPSVSGTPVDMAYDYSTGLMYVLTLNFNTYENKLYTVNMNNGAVHEEGAGYGLLTLACDTEGNLYAGDLSGYLCQVFIQDYSDWGMGMMIEAMPVIEEPLGEMYMLQSMCYDHNYDVFLWACCDATSVFWIDLKGETPVVVSLGDPTESGVFEFVGLHVVPNEIPELQDTAVSSVTAEDMLILTGYEKFPAVTVAPFNATCQDVTMTSSDTSVVEITESGSLLGVSEGTATISVSLNDTVGGIAYEVEFTVTVTDGADNMYAHLLTDLATMDAQLWIELNPADPGVYEALAYFDYTIYTAEYYDGKIYTYGYDAYDWTANWQFFVLDAESYAIEKQIDMGEAFPYVYDMTYDYSTSTMYLLAGAAEDDTNLYVADMTTGEAVLLMETEPLLMAISASPDGKLYAIEQSGMEMDWMTYETVYTPAKLHAIDPLAGTIELIGETGINSNMIGSMAYDYDTDNLYWVSFAQTTGYESSLSIVDTETGAATSLGTIGSVGAQVGGLYFVCDEFPTEDKTVLHNVLMATPKATVFEGSTVQLNALSIPMGVDAPIIWTSSNETIATVDANGVVTGISQGKVTVTASVTLGDKILTAEAAVAVLDADASFLSYNVTDKCWTNISRADTMVASNQGEPADYPEVITFAVDGETVYGYDVNNQLFSMDPETLERTNIGDGLGIEVEEDCIFDIRDMSYDAANDRILVLGAILMWDDYFGEYDEIYGGCGIYEVDVTTGELTLLQSIEEQFRVFAMTAGTAGEVYYYSVFDDYITKMDMTTGETSSLVTLQSQSVYGDMECDYALYYDELTDTLYLLFTSNGRFYKLHTIDATTGLFIQGDYVGEIIEEDQGGWSIYYGDDFNGLTFINVMKQPAVSFTDVTDPAAYYYEPVAWAVANGITTGTTPTTFSPNANCERAQIVTFLWRAAGQPEPESTVNPFEDVKETDYFYKAVLWAVENGITNGMDDTHFEPFTECTRGQAVTFLWRVAGKPMATDTSSFNDVAPGTYYYDAVNWAVENEITNGMDDNKFQPDSTCTRGQIVTFLYRYMN